MEGRKAELRRLESLFDVKGKQFLREKLLKSIHNRESIANIQTELSLGSKRCEPILQLLDVVGCSRASVYRNLLESAKATLDDQLEKMDRAGLLSILHETIGCVTIKELKSIPISIIKRLDVVPDSYIALLSKSGRLDDLPLSIRQQVWQMDSSSFESALEVSCRQILLTNDLFSTG